MSGRATSSIASIAIPIAITALATAASSWPPAWPPRRRRSREGGPRCRVQDRPAVRFTDVTAQAGIQLRPQRRPHGQEAPPRDARLRRRLLRRRRRRLARHPAHQRQGLEPQGTQDRCPPSTATITTAPSPTSPRGSGLDVEMLRHGRRRRRLRQRRPRGRLHHRARRRPPLPQRGARQVQGRHRRRRDQERELRHQRRLARLRPRRQARPLRRQLRAVDAGERPLVLARRRPPSPTARRSPTRATASKLYHNLGERPVRGRQPASAGIDDADRKVARRHRARLRRRRLAGPLRRQRHPAQQALPQPEQRHLQGRRRSRPASPSARTATARGAMGVDAADYDRSGRPHLLVGNFSNQMLALYHNEGNGVFVDEAPSLGGGAGEPADAHLRRLLLRLRPGRPARHLRRQRPPRGGDQPRAAAGHATSSRRWSSTTSARGRSPTSAAARWAPTSSGRSWRAARPTATSTTTATSTS